MTYIIQKKKSDIAQIFYVGKVIVKADKQKQWMGLM